MEYVSIDMNPLPDISYYRLKQFDYDGTYSYSGVETFHNSNGDTFDFKISPNPNYGRITKVCVSGTAPKFSFSLIDTNGVIIQRKNFLRQGMINFSLILTTNLEYMS